MGAGKKMHEVTLPTFVTDKYPVSNAEFTRFIAEGGYVTPKYWTATGWREKEKKSWTQPRYWSRNNPAQPVVGISWYEAVPARYASFKECYQNAKPGYQSLEKPFSLWQHPLRSGKQHGLVDTPTL